MGAPPNFEVKDKTMLKAIFRGMVPIIDDNLMSSLKILLNEKIITILPDASDFSDTTADANKKKNKRKKTLEGNLHNFFFDKPELFMEIDSSEVDSKGKREITIKPADPTIFEVFQRFHGRLIPGKTYAVDLNFLAVYYEGLLIDSIESVLSGKPVITDSQAIINLFQYVTTIDSFGLQNLKEKFRELSLPKFSFDILNTSLLDVSSLNISDVLEARHSLRDELLAFRNELERLHYEFINEFGFEKVIREGKSIAKYRLQPRINDLKSKIESRKYLILKKLFEILKNPSAYVPFIGSTLAGLPMEIALLVSAGLLSAELATDLWQQQKGLKKDGFLYLLKIQQKFKESKKSSLTKTSEIPVISSPRDKGEIQENAKLMYLWPSQIEKIEKSE